MVQRYEIILRITNFGGRKGMLLGDVFAILYEKRFSQRIKQFCEKRLNFRSLYYLIFIFPDK